MLLCACENTESKILVLEKECYHMVRALRMLVLPGSISEIIDDLKSHSEEEVYQLVTKRLEGLRLLRKRLGDEAIDFKPYGGYELFLKDENCYEECMNKLPFINEVLKPLLNRTCLLKKLIVLVLMGWEHLVFNPFEAQIDTGNMMQKLLKQAVSNDILILNQQTVTSFVDKGVAVEVVLNDFSFRSKYSLPLTDLQIH
jgi:hypothetical protein